MSHAYEETRDMDDRKGRSYDRPLKVGAPGFEPGTSASRTQRSTGLSHAPIVLSRQVERNAVDLEQALLANYVLTAVVQAGNRIRTGDLNLGKVALYQLSYACMSCASAIHQATGRN